jgi:hypothetical protein
MNVPTPVSGVRPAARERWRAWTCGILAAVATWGALRFGTFEAIQSSLDGSWVAALGEAASRGDIFGRDIIYTGGPFTTLYTRYFDSVQWPFVLAAELPIVGAMAWSCGRLAANWPLALLLPLSILFASARDSLLLALPALAALAVLKRPGASYFFIVLAAIAAAAIILAKFSPVLVAVVAFVAIDIELANERRAPLATVTFVAALVTWYAAVEDGIAYFADFIRYSLETSAGYSAAMSVMSLGKSAFELAGFLAFALISGAVVVLREWQRAASGAARRPLLTVLVVGALGFTAFKDGFVRHDMHSLIGWDAAALAAVAYAAFEEQPLLRWLTIAASLTASAMGFVDLSFKAHTGPLTAITRDLEQLGDNLKGVAIFARDPDGWLREQRARMRQGRAAVHAALPLPPIQGSVDILPSMQSAVIAAGLDYRPRFTIQDYTTYTQALIEKNRQSWFGARAPDHILFGIVPVDNRLPALSEGPLWPDLLRFYAPARRLPTLALLDRRPHPLADLLSAPRHSSGRLNRPFALSGDPTFLTLDVRYTWLGRLLTIVFKPPPVGLRLVHADGRQEEYRIIPAIARAGFVVSPEVKSADDYFALALGEDSAFAASARPTAAAVEVDWLGSLAYEPEIAITSRTIDLAILRAARPAGPPQPDR